MASKEQFEHFRYLYEEESTRYSDLESRSKMYFGLISVLLTGLLFKAEDVRSSFHLLKIPWIIAIVEALLLAAATLFTVISVKIRKYEVSNTPEDVANDMEERSMDNEAFYDARIAEFVVATERNSQVNDTVARWLELAGWMLFASIIGLLMFLAISILGLN